MEPIIQCSIASLLLQVLCVVTSLRDASKGPYAIAMQAGYMLVPPICTLVLIFSQICFFLFSSLRYSISCYCVNILLLIVFPLCCLYCGQISINLLLLLLVTVSILFLLLFIDLFIYLHEHISLVKRTTPEFFCFCWYLLLVFSLCYLRCFVNSHHIYLAKVILVELDLFIFC